MGIKYTSEKNSLMTLSLMKEHGVRRVIVSPGGTNVCFATSLMNDGDFILYSCVDERSAAYIACGIAEETGEPVALCCTGATASRNYVPGLTEAFYRQLPILVITTSQFEGKVGNLFPQVTDRWKQMNDILRYSTHIPVRIENSDEKWFYNLEINKALIALTADGGGPSHINLATDSSTDFSVEILPKERVIKKYTIDDRLPTLSEGKVAIFVGNHKKWSRLLVEKVERFCEKYNAVVICDHTSNYHGKYKVEACIVTTQVQYESVLSHFDTMIHIGDVSGSYMKLKPCSVWRVNPDGMVRDAFYKLRAVFEMSESAFFDYYVGDMECEPCVSFWKSWDDECKRIRRNIPKLPLSNAWLAQMTAPLLPSNCEVHFGILNSLRTWNYFEFKENIDCFCNTGGFGIDGCISSAIGASIVNGDKPCLCIVGDLAFFYDLNSMGNRHIGPNLRIILVNNGCGAEFHIPACVTKRAGLDTETINKYTAAAGHYGSQSVDLVRQYAEGLGFEYFAVQSTQEYMNVLEKLTGPSISDKPLLVEVFTKVEDDAEAMRILTNLDKTVLGTAKQLAKNFLGGRNIQKIKDSLSK